MQFCLINMGSGVGVCGFLKPHMHAVNVHKLGIDLYTSLGAFRSVCLFWSVTPFTRLRCLWDLLGLELSRSGTYRVVGYLLRGQFLSSQYYTVLVCLAAVCGLNVLPTVCGLYFSAFWLEREVWDFLGILFSKHHSMRRIFNDYYFLGFPLRRGYVVGGFGESLFDFRSRCVGTRSRLGRPAVLY